MQIQKVNSQLPVGQNKQNKSKCQPAFGMKIYMDKKLAQNVVSDVNDLMKVADYDSKVIKPVFSEVKNFIKELSKNIAEHNSNPENHRLFNKQLHIEKLEVGYKDNDGHFLGLADSSGDKSSLETSGKSILKHFEDFHKYSRYNVDTLLSARIKTNTGAEIYTARFGTLKQEDKFKKLSSEIQNAEVERLENENSDLYLDMIQPPKGARH